MRYCGCELNEANHKWRFFYFYIYFSWANIKQMLRKEVPRKEMLTVWDIIRYTRYYDTYAWERIIPICPVTYCVCAYTHYTLSFQSFIRTIWFTHTQHTITQSKREQKRTTEKQRNIGECWANRKDRKENITIIQRMYYKLPLFTEDCWWMQSMKENCVSQK